MISIRYYPLALVLAASLVGATACDQNSPTGPAATDPASLSFTPVDPRVGKFDVCATGADASFSWVEKDATQTVIINQSASPVSVPAGTCATLTTFYGPGLHYVTVTEASHQSGFVLDSVHVLRIIDQLTLPGTEVHTTLIGPTSATGPVNNDFGHIVTFYYTPEIVETPEGCSPGYWKNHLSSWPVSTSLDFDATFGVDFFNPNKTLLQALSLNGGGVNALARHAVSAYLNSLAFSNSFYTTAQVIAFVQAQDKASLETANSDDDGTVVCTID